MKLSRVLVIILFGAVTMTNSAMALGTTAGTKITNTSILIYTMNGESQELKAIASSYVVDKILNFTVALQETKERTLVMGEEGYGQFLVTNNGNSIEDFVLDGSYGNSKSFSFSNIKIYIDKNSNGILDVEEKVDTSVISKLAIGGKKIVWIEVKRFSSTNLIGKKTNFGLMVRASSSGVNGIYKTETLKNSMSKVDIVFADGGRDNDRVRNNIVVNRYNWRLIKVSSSLKLDKNLEFDHITADPKNGTTKSRQEAENDKFKPVATATRVKVWEIKNSNPTVGKNIKISVPIDSTNERISSSSEYTWWGATEGRVHLVWDEASQTVVGVGTYNPVTKMVDFVIKEIKSGQKLYLHVVTVLIADVKVGKLDIKNIWNIISADPVNGICKDADDAKMGNYKAIPGATSVRSWEIVNNTKKVAKDVKFSIKINPNVEKIATTSKNTWWKNDKRVHIVHVTGKGIIGAGAYNSSRNSVDFFFREIKVGEKVHPHIVTEIK